MATSTSTGAVPFFPPMDENWRRATLFRGARNKVQGGRFPSVEDLPMKNTHNATPMQEQPQAGESVKVICPGETAHDGIDRRNFLSCMAWAGTGLLWTMAGGVPTSKLFSATTDAAAQAAHSKAGSGFSFVQISDSHIGFNKAANQDVTGTLKIALDKINALPAPPELLLHTGDITHSSKPAEFDTAQQLIKGVKVGESFYVPGEHDIATDDGAMYHERFGAGSQGRGWYSFTHK